MALEENSFISGGNNLYYPGVLRSIKKSGNVLQPLFEAFTNALEAIRDREKAEPDFDGAITIKVYQNVLTDESTEFVRLAIEDNGKGFDDKEFSRFNRYKDFSKGFKNLGSGRIQYVHFFEKTLIQSTFIKDGKYFKREFIVSKHDDFVKHNAIIKHLRTNESKEGQVGSIITFTDLLDKGHASYHNLDCKTLKKNLLDRYLQYFCVNRDSLPEIRIQRYVQGEVKCDISISEEDIPSIDQQTTVSLNYKRSEIRESGVEIIDTDRSESFDIISFKASPSVIHGNKIQLTSKDEVIEDFDINLSSLSKTDIVEDNQYLFLVSSDYIDNRDSDTRGELKIPDRKAFKKGHNSLYGHEEILLDDITEQVNAKIDQLYPEFETQRKKHEQNLEKLKNMFLLDDGIIDEIKVSLNDSENKILEKFYSYEAKKVAKLDASIKERIDHLDSLNTTSSDYPEELLKEVEELSITIPQQNKAALTQYVARRKLVLELFQKILDKQLAIQSETSRNIDEKLLHNLIFQQSNSSPDQSDLWLINEEFIYFKGTSEDRLSDVSINGVKLLRDDLSSEEEKYRKALDEDRYSKRPDVLLFPEEGKCIIIEFKNPDVNASDHLSQINNYASLIWNFGREEHRFTTFYGYLIGEKISNFDVRSKDSDFKVAYGFDYLFRPYKQIVGFFGKDGDNAELYTEVIKYSTLLARAKRRNQVFIDKLTSTENVN